MHFLAGLTHSVIEELGYLQMPKLKGSRIRQLMPSNVRILDAMKEWGLRQAATIGIPVAYRYTPLVAAASGSACAPRQIHILGTGVL